MPTDTEWSTLIGTLGGENSAGSKLKETGIIHWMSPDTGAVNQSGFTAIPEGERDHDGAFYYMGYSAYWWSNPEYSNESAFCRSVKSSDRWAYMYEQPKDFGLKVRCVKDN